MPMWPNPPVEKDRLQTTLADSLRGFAAPEAPHLAVRSYKNMHLDRITALEKLIAYQLPIEPVMATLASFDWDSVAPLITLSSESILPVIERYLSGEITSEQLTDWANLIECREDIHVSNASQNLAEVIFRLANPYLREPITPVLVTEIRNALLAERNTG